MVQQQKQQHPLRWGTWRMVGGPCRRGLDWMETQGLGRALGYWVGFGMEGRARPQKQEGEGQVAGQAVSVWVVR